MKKSLFYDPSFWQGMGRDKMTMITSIELWPRRLRASGLGMIKIVQTAQRLCDAPSLSYTAARGERRFRIEYLADGSDLGIIEMCEQPCQKRFRFKLSFRSCLNACINKRADKPSPNGALMRNPTVAQVSSQFRTLRRRTAPIQQVTMPASTSASPR